MKKEIILTIIILFIIVIADRITTKMIDEKIDEVSILLEELSDIIQDEDMLEVNDKFEKIENLWKMADSNFSYYIEHDELEKVGTEMNSLKSSIETENWDEGENNIQRLQFILEHIKDKMDLKLKNIF